MNLHKTTHRRKNLIKQKFKEGRIVLSIIVRSKSAAKFRLL
jgi:hypothetical protein